MEKTAYLAMLATVAVAVEIVSSGGAYMTRGQGLSCQGDIGALAIRCGPYVQNGSAKMDPSQGCCDVLEEADVQCICERMPAGFDNMVDMDKVSYVCQFCGKPLEPGSKCGSGNTL